MSTDQNAQDGGYNTVTTEASETDQTAKAIEVVSDIVVHWNADGTPKSYLLDLEDARLVVERLQAAGLLS